MSEFALTKEERKELLTESQMRRMAEMYLDLEHKYTLPEMAEELGMTVRQVKYLATKEPFTEIYNETLAAITGRSRLAVLHDMQSNTLEEAYVAHRELIKESPPVVQLSAIRLLYQTLKLDAGEVIGKDDRDELKDFQERLGKQFNIQNFNVFLQALEKTAPQDTPQNADAEFRVLPGEAEDTTCPEEDIGESYSSPARPEGSPD